MLQKNMLSLQKLASKMSLSAFASVVSLHICVSYTQDTANIRNPSPMELLAISQTLTAAPRCLHMGSRASGK